MVTLSAFYVFYGFSAFAVVPGGDVIRLLCVFYGFSAFAVVPGVSG